MTLTTATAVTAPAITTTVNGASQDLSTGTLTVLSTAGFNPFGGTFTVNGTAGTCTYTSASGTAFSGITGCTGKPADKATVTMVTTVDLPVLTTTVNGASQTLGATLTVKSTTGFASTGGTFTVTGATGTCTYTGTTATTFTGITGCTGSPADQALVTLTSVPPPSTTVNVVSTNGFDPLEGAFTAAGLTGTCSYTGTTATAFLDVTGCTGAIADAAAVQRVELLPGIYVFQKPFPLLDGDWEGVFPSGPILPTSPVDGQYFLLTGSVTTPGTLAPGLYKFDASKIATNGGWVSENDVDFPTSPAPAEGDFFQLTENSFLADGTSGAGGDKDKVSIAGALGLNIVSNHTSATVGAAETINAGTGPITLKAIEQRRGRREGRLRREVRLGRHRRLGRDRRRERHRHERRDPERGDRQRRRCPDDLGRHDSQRRDRGQGRLRGRRRDQPVRLDRDRCGPDDGDHRDRRGHVGKR